MLFLLSRGLPLLLELGLLVFCLIDCVQTPEDAVRNLPKGVWILLIVLIPLVGGIAWLVAGRPTRESSMPYVTGYPEYQRSRAPRRPIAPDDDPEFLQELGRVNGEHEQTLQKWERELARREEELRRREQGEPPEVG